MELSRFFIKDLVSKKIHQVSFFDTKYVNVETTSLFKIIRTFLTTLKYYFLKNKVMPQNYLKTLQYNATKIYGNYNEYLINNGEPVINYEEYFEQFIKKKVPSYIN